MADAAALESAAATLIARAEDLAYLGDQIVLHGTRAHWECAKADRFREAMVARRRESSRVAFEMRELGRAVRARAMAAEAVEQAGT
ncbi:MAG: hypothetical protein KQH57_19960 [Actinomycetales bacterium]|nr:hypothetical protein [Actinomycetales bacterium]